MKSAVTKPPPRRTSHTKSGESKAAKASAPTKPPPKNVAAKTTSTPTPKPANPAPAPAKSEPAVKAAARPPPPDPSKPIVLEKPERFNPPSHGARLPRSTPRHYGGSLTAEEVAAQTRKTYPGLPPPPKTWSHWFINSRGIHTFITLGTLTGLAAYTFASHFKSTSPFADLIPPISEFPRHPFQYVGVCVDVLRMHEEHESALTAEKRRRRVDDVAKRNEYRKAHGLEPATSSGFFGGKAEVAEEAADTASPIAAVEPVEAEPTVSEGKRKKFLGIF